MSMSRVGELATIQVVEDDPVLADDICGSLRELGYYPLRPVPSITDALVACERERPDVVLIDIMLAGEGDGIELGTLLKQKYSLRIIYLTSLRDRETIHQATQTQPDGYLIKPVGRDSLFATIEVALQRGGASVEESDRGGHRMSPRLKR
ncbi:MAG: response regulator, partial [Myxococcota bacterium]